MVQQPIELILMRELADHLATPIFVVDPDGTLELLDEHAEAILGLRFEETGPMPVAESATAFSRRMTSERPWRQSDSRW